MIVNSYPGGGVGSASGGGGGWGHAWVTGVDAAGNATSHGSWPTTAAGKESVLPWKSYPGAISSQDGLVDGDYTDFVSQPYDVTPEQYAAFMDFINAEKARSDREWSLRNNCTDFAVDAAEAAGIDLNNYSTLGHSDPAALADSLGKSCSLTRRGMRCR